MRKPGDDVEAALAALRRVTDAPVPLEDNFEVLHRSNNVVVRVGSAVAKVMMTEDPAVDLEHDLSVFGSQVAAPVLEPLALPSIVGEHAVTWWPYVESIGPGTSEAVAEALACFHERMAATTVPVRSLRDFAEETLSVAEDDHASAAMPREVREAVCDVLKAMADWQSSSDDPVVHGEPQSRNYLVTQNGVVLIDLESCRRVPVEWDLGFLPAGVVEQFWPDHDTGLLETFRDMVSAQVATACWRQLTMRPGEERARWHAEYHSHRLLDRTTRGL